MARSNYATVVSNKDIMKIEVHYLLAVEVLIRGFVTTTGPVMSQLNGYCIHSVYVSSIDK